MLFSQGEMAEAAYVVMRGGIDLVAQRGGDTVRLGRRRQGEIVGELALMAHRAHAETAVITEHSEVLVMTRDQLSRRIGTVDPVLRLWLGAIFDRLRADPAAGEDDPVPAPEPAWAEHIAAASTLLDSEHDLRQAIAGEGLVPRFQPIIHLPSRRLAGFETLIRWQHPAQGLLNPDRFIPLAEKTGMISELTRACLRAVAREFPVLSAAARAAAAPGDPPLFLTVNVSGMDLRRPDFAANTVAILAEGGIDPRDIHLEITESMLISDPEVSVRTLQQCRDHGMKIAIDDFGTGYSSLNYLHTLPVSTLKMDRSFAKALLSDPAGRKVIAAILHLGGELDLDVVAEGIEAEDEAAVLTAMGCGYGQGFLFARPAPLAEAVELVATWRPAPLTRPAARFAMR